MNVVDMTGKNIEKESDFYSIVETYTDDPYFLVTREQKERISTFAAGNTRYAMVEGYSRPVMVYKGDIGAVYVITKEELDGLTKEEKKNKVN